MSESDCRCVEELWRKLIRLFWGAVIGYVAIQAVTQYGADILSGTLALMYLAVDWTGLYAGAHPALYEVLFWWSVAIATIWALIRLSILLQEHQEHYQE